MQRWPYITEEVRRILASMIQLCDINRWSLNVGDIRLTAGSVWDWYCTIPVILVMETLVAQYAIQNGWLNNEPTFERAINVLYHQEVLNQLLKDWLHYWRKVRNMVHLHLQEGVVIHSNPPKMYNDAVLTLQAVEDALLSDWKQNYYS